MSESKTTRRSGLRIMVELLRLLGKLRYLILIAVAGGFLGNACAIGVTTLGACCVAKVIDPGFTALSVGNLVALTILAGVLRGLLRFLEQYNNHNIAFRLLAVLRDKLFRALRRLAPAKLEGRQKGAVISMLTSDVETLEVFYAHTISPILIAILVDGIVTVLVGVIGSIWLAVIALIAYLVIGVAIPFISSAMLKQEGVIYRQQFADSSSYFLDSVRGIREIVHYGQQNERLRELDSRSEALNGRTVSIKEKSSAVSAASSLAVSLAILLSAFAGISEVLNGSLTASQMVVALVLLFSSFGPVLSLAALPSNLTQTFAAGDRILEFMAEEPAVQETTDGSDFRYEAAELQQVSFSYGGSPVLQDVSLKLPEHGIIGLVGPSGCGKSTLLKLLLRFYDVDSGRICYNGLALPEINAASLHENVTMVSQDTYLFDDTILNNLLIAKADATLEEVRGACALASVDELIMSLPEGYHTEAGLLGDGLSTGEKQRIGLARAFLSGARLILLDEVTSNVDAINEGIILKSLRDAAADHTIVLVSHRESTVRICDQVWHLEGGRLVK